MGQKYTEVVKTFLTGLDSGNEDFEDEIEAEDKEGGCIGVRYIQKVGFIHPVDSNQDC